MGNRSKSGKNDYQRGYGNGVRAAVDALLDDLQAAERLTDVDYDEDGRSKVCTGCLLRDQEFPALATRWEFVMGVGHE